MQTKKIILISKEEPEKLPPVITAALSLRKCGMSVHLIASTINENVKLLLEDNGICCCELFSKRQSSSQSIIKKIKFWHQFRMRAKREINKHDLHDYLWICSGDTAVALGTFFLNRKYVLHLHELYDRQKFYIKQLRKFAKNTTLTIVPDNARAVIFRYWYDLNYTPLVIPNKPIIEETTKDIEEISPYNYNLLQKYQTKKIILYQAKMIRMKLYDVAEALRQLGDQYVLGLLGDIRDKAMVATLLDKYENVVHFEYMTPPYHLLLTKRAYIGILTYNYESLNNIFCAPNKTWEYSKFSVPMLANNLPVLKLQLENFIAGETYEFDDVDSIKKSILKIEQSYNIYKKGAQRLYDSVDMQALYRDVILRLEK